LFAIILQLIFNGLMLGSLYALAAVGLSLIFGIMGVVNLSHGSQLAMAVFISFWLYSWLRCDIITAAVLSVLLVFLIGLFIERVAIYPFRAEEMKLIVMTFGLGKILEQIIYLIWGPIYITTPIYISGSIDLFGVTLVIYRVFLLIFSIALILLLWIFIQRFKLGKAIRAVAQDEEAAAIYGVNVRWIRTLTFAIASALAAVAGVFLSSIFMFQSASGWEYLSIALSITIVGGLGDIRGAIVASFIMGLVESCIGYFISPLWRATVYFVLIIIILTIKPSGISGLFRRG